MQESSNRNLIIAVVVVLLICCCLALAISGWFYWGDPLAEALGLEPF